MKLTGEHLEQLTQGIQKTLLHGNVWWIYTQMLIRMAHYIILTFISIFILKSFLYLE